MKLLKGVVYIHINWKKITCIFSGGCIEDPQELSICIADNMVSLYCERCGSFIRNTPLHDIIDPDMLNVIDYLLEEEDDD